MPVVTLIHLQHPWFQTLQSPHPQCPQHLKWHPATLPLYLVICASIPLTTPNTSGSSISPAPPYISTRITIGKRPKLCHSTQVPLQRGIHYSSERRLFLTPPREADELRSDISCLLRNPNHNNKTNLTIQECRALTELKQDTSMVVLTADKGVAMVIMDQQDYNYKAQTLLQDTNTYKVLNKGPTSRLKNKLIQTPKDIKQSGGLSDSKYRKLYPTSAVPQVLWPPQNTQSWHPLRPIVFNRGSITYGVEKELAYIIKPLVGQSPHHLKNTQHFVQHIHNKRLEPGEVITCFDVKALFTSIPVDTSIEIVQHKLAQDPTLPQRTSMSIQLIVTLLEFCLKTTYIFPLPR